MQYTNTFIRILAFRQSSAKTLIVSYMGMTTQEVTIHPYVKVMMQSDAEVLEEVVIAVPYGTVKKANFSGSAAQVTGEKLAEMQVANISNALQGSIAGVQTVSSSGTPGRCWTAPAAAHWPGRTDSPRYSSEGRNPSAGALRPPPAGPCHS